MRYFDEERGPPIITGGPLVFYRHGSRQASKIEAR
jgi:hypothetical protein